MFRAENVLAIWNSCIFCIMLSEFCESKNFREHSFLSTKFVDIMGKDICVRQGSKTHLIQGAPQWRNLVRQGPE
uniref:Putative secreted protein n=1 Tax=Rhipicephalus microplus TaxID=6941 RepID=A0A6G5A1U3_RHIMP